MIKYINRKNIIINSILEKREQSASLIQYKFRTFMMKQDLIALAKKHKFYYSIYPSFISETSKNKSNLKIKLYTDLSSPNNYSILPVRFCPLRNCHVFDIPKKKFLSYKKIMNFNFLTHNNKVVIDPKYKIVLFGDEYVNQIDFKKFDKKENTKNNYIKYSLNKNDSSGSESGASDCYSDYEDIDDSEKEDLNENLDINNCLSHSIINLSKSKFENELMNSNTNSNSTKDSLRMNSPVKKYKKKRSKSILKNKNGSKSISKDRMSKRNCKRVSFGSSQISFYRSQFLK